ncbi:hypothetical protein BGW42_003410 [Actinomortierella wolfii]|nr:hypothetical protein BGW42_003410 [Actinomortierella wolfii]
MEPMMNDVLAIPGCINLLVSYLDKASLASCVRVSRAWHAFFIPYLWHSFGTVHPVRFGIAYGSSTKVATFPLQLADPNDPTKTIRALSIASPEHYPEYFAAQSRHQQQQDQQHQSMWVRLFTRQAVTTEEFDEMHVIVAKHAHYIRSLTIRSVEAFRLFESLCTNLQQLHMRFGWDWTKGLTFNDIGQIKQDVLNFARRQIATLDSLNLHMGMLDAEHLRETIRLGGHERWRYFNVMLVEQDYYDLGTLMPNVVSASFLLEAPHVLQTPLPAPHTRLRELEISASTFDYTSFRAILQSFPNLQRLVIQNMYLGTLFDMVRDSTGSMLQIGRRALKSDQVASIIALLPDLLLIDCHDLDSACWTALSQHCPRLVYPNKPVATATQ